MTDIYARAGDGIMRKFVDIGEQDGKRVHAEVVAVEGGAGGSGPSGQPLTLPWSMTITDGAEYILTWPGGRGGPLTVWKGPGDTIEIAKRDGDGQDWDVLVNDNLTWSSDLVEGVVYQVRFRRTSGAGSTVVGGRG
jgi:hypothetical protein